MSSSEMAYAEGSFISETCLIQSVRWGLLYANEAVQSNAKGGDMAILIPSGGS